MFELSILGLVYDLMMSKMQLVCSSILIMLTCETARSFKNIWSNKTSHFTPKKQNKTLPFIYNNERECEMAEKFDSLL